MLPRTLYGYTVQHNRVSYSMYSKLCTLCTVQCTRALDHLHRLLADEKPNTLFYFSY